MFFCTFFMWYRIILSLPGLNICQDGPSAIQNYSSKMLPNRSCSFSTNPSVLGSGEWVINLTASYQLLELLSPKESELLWDSCFFNILLFPSLSQSEINLSISFLQLLKILMLKQNLNGVAFTIPYSDLFFFFLFIFLLLFIPPTTDLPIPSTFLPPYCLFQSSKNTQC